ncbi:MAG: potassium transporter Kup [Rhodocyclaceae bacterium]|nr:potassium transporter Kup [Rhodocyclaceae bacterium]
MNTAETQSGSDSPHKSNTAVLAMAALGVVYGDLGTSPLYALKEAFAGTHPVPYSADNVIGILSLILWALIVVVAVKYVTFIMRADNRGEGGIMALIALALADAKGNPKQERWIMMIGILGAAMFFGDGMVTPAISVLSAVEGLEVATPVLKPWVIPIALLVLFLLFFVQKRGTARVGALFGPVMLLWFATLAALGVYNLVAHPGVVKALNPLYGLGFIAHNPGIALVAMGAVVLSVTGAEALYADMGHFGRKPIQLAWFGFVLPALMLNYFGQGAVILDDPQAVQNPFYRSAPGWALYPLIALSTLATVIASQSVISGAFSITRQAMQLGFVPRVEVQHTSEKEQGQIYLPAVNWGLMLAVMVLVLGFRSSSNMAAAYGLAVTGDMVITSLLAAVVAAKGWGWGWGRAGALFGCFLAVELLFLVANIEKIPYGGWFPLVVGVVVFTLMTTWKRGRDLLLARLRADALGLRAFIDSLELAPPPTIPGTAVFLTSNPDGVPLALLHNLMHNKVLHERIVVLTVQVHDVPYVPEVDRVEVHPVGGQFWQVLVRYGFKDEPDIPAALAQGRQAGLPFEMMETSFFLGRETLIARAQVESGMAYWRKKLFVAMFRNAGSATAFFKIPSNRVVELGTQVELR